MASEYTSNHLPADNQSLAAMIVEGSQAEQSGKSTNYDARVKSDDATSVMSRSSFGSTVGLLKNKLNPSSKSNRENDKQRGKEQRELLRNQMRIVG
ncbi:hypothetical protein VTK73DRAFT_8327 [Phialemonium thermophilum]|uniref:Uncharacterized protein n=1 Tax=Phialemonium thermophilum TaxID=223376 RepID=A0ABR3Y682_9PEZI